MLDLGWPELFVIVLVALVVLGPKELPGAIRTVTGLVRRARGLAREFHKSIDEMAKETGLDNIKRDLQKAVKSELNDDGLLGDPFAEADKNSILNPTNGSKLPSPKGQPSAKSEPAKSEPRKAKSAKSEPTKAKSARSEPTKAKSAKSEPTKAKSAKSEPTKAKSAKSKPTKAKSANAKSNGKVAKNEVADKPAVGAKPAAPVPITSPEVAEAEAAPAPETAQEVAKEDGRA